MNSNEPVTEEKKKRVPKEPLIARDALGQEILLDQVVAAPYTRSMLLIGRIMKISDKTVLIRRLGKGDQWTERKRHEEVVIISDNPATTMFVIQNE